MSNDDCREDKKYTMFERFLYEVKKLVPIFVVVLLAASLLLVDTSRWYTRWIQDVPQLVLAIISLSTTAFMLGFIKIIMTWLFPGFHFTLLFREVEKDKNLPAAITIAIMLIFFMFLIWITIRPRSAGAEEIVCHDKVLMKARPYLPMIEKAYVQYWPDAPMKETIAGKLDRETACPNMKKCWNPKVELKTSREWGIGLSQVTIAYNADGTERFNNFKEAKRKYSEALSAWDFEDKYEPRYHILFTVLEDKTNFMRMRLLFKDSVNRWAGTLVSYNAGPGRVNSRFAICKITPGCDTSKWFGGLDKVASPAEKKLIYGVPLQERVNDYPADVIFKRSKKYMGEL